MAVLHQREQIFIKKMKAPENLLIVRTDRIGDVVLSLPLAGLVKKHYPACKVSFLVKDYTKDLVENHPFIDEILILKEENEKVSIKKNIDKLKQKKFDACIVVYPTFTVSLILFLSNIKERIGTGYRWYSFLFNRKVYEHRKFAKKHELEYNVNLLKEIGIDDKILPGNVNFDIHIKESSYSLIDTLLAENNVKQGTKIVVVHPGSGGSSVDLPLEKFVYLTKHLSKINDVQVVLTGTENEKNLCEKLVAGNSAINLAGKLNLSELKALLNRIEIFVSNSTGPLHIAAALGKFTVGFFPKILACSAQRWGPYTEKKALFLPEINCKNCTREQCMKLDCMNSIDIDNVFTKIKNELNV